MEFDASKLDALIGQQGQSHERAECLEEWVCELLTKTKHTEICVTFPVLQMLEEGYEVHVSADASASWSKDGNDLALRRMENAGAVITTVDQIISELAIDWTSPNGKKLEAILEYR